MSKCLDEFIKHHGLPPESLHEDAWKDWQAAWNARGKVDAGICRSKNPNPDQWSDTSEYVEKRVVLACAEAIEQEDEQ